MSDISIAKVVEVERLVETATLAAEAGSWRKASLYAHKAYHVCQDDLPRSDPGCWDLGTAVFRFMGDIDRVRA